MAPSAIVVVPIPNEVIMGALQLTAVTTLACFATMSLWYGEILLLKKI